MSVINYKNLKVGSAYLVSGQVFQALLAFGVNLVLVRHISPGEFGRFALILAGASIVFSAISPRINILIIRMAEVDYDAKVKEIFFSAMALETLVAAFIIFLWLGVSGNAGFWEILLVVAVGLRHWTDLNKAFYERTMPFRQLAVMETGASAGGHLVALAMVLSGFGWVVLFIREAVISIVNLFGLWRVGSLTLYRVRLLTMAEWLALYKDARGVWLDGVLEGNFQRLPILLAGLLGSEATAGLFFQAQRLAIVPHQVLSPVINRVLANWFGRMEDAKLRKEGRNRFLLVIFVLLLPAGILTFQFASPVVPWLFGEGWARVADIVAAMCGMVTFFSLFETLKVYCLSARHSIKVFIGRLVQYASLLGLAAAGFAGLLDADISLAAGLSAAYLLAFLTIFALFRLEERKE